MKKFLVVLCCVALCGCGSVVRKQPEILNTQIEKLPEIQLSPVLPDRPKATIVVDSQGNKYGGFDLRSMDALNQYAKQSEANTRALQELVSAHNQLIQQRNLMVDLVKREEERGNMYSTMYTESQNQIAEERRLNFVEKAFLQAIILLGLVL